MTTALIYLQDTDRLTLSATIQAIETDDKGTYLAFNQTVFYPQGGGQPYDTGYIEIPNQSIPVTAVRIIEGIVRHYTSGPIATPENLIGQLATQHIDATRRHLNACYHTAAHLLSHGVEVILPHCLATKGHAFPGEAYVEFTGVSSIPDSFKLLLESTLSAKIAANPSITITETTPEAFKAACPSLPLAPFQTATLRLIQIGSEHPIPCGGIHLKHLAPLGHMLITKTKLKGDQLKVSYALETH